MLAKLQTDMKTAMKAGDKQRLSVIRMLISDIKVIDLQTVKQTPLQVVESYAKKLRKTQEEFTKLGKPVEAEQIAAELTIVGEYLPKKLSAEETAKLVDAFLAENAFTEKQVGQAMGAFLKLHGAEVDGAIVNPLVRERLAGK